ncbi:MAG: hypothetical protein NWF06_04820 [Candidatus Bathyarchaeota archaeon]|nr:hypothetical protein [Candidatus Bathyarchaeum sp.]
MLVEAQVRTLVDLGLTPLQARVYFSVFCLGESTAKEACNCSNVPRQDIYRIIKELQKLGLIEKIIARPTRFRAIPIKEATSILLNHKKTVLKQLVVKAKKLNTIQKTDIPNIANEAQQRFIIVPKTKEPLKRAAESMLKAQKSFDGIGSATRVLYFIKNYPECIEEINKKEIKTRHIVEKPENKDARKTLEHVSANNKLFEIRYSNKIHRQMGIIDGKEAYIPLSPMRGLTQDFELYTNSPDLVEILSSYYEAIWSQATPILKTTKIR